MANKAIKKYPGEKNGFSKLTNKYVLAIRKTEDKSQRELAEEFNVSQATIWRVLAGKVWKHVV